MTNINKNISNRSKAYTPDEVAEVMEVLRLNNFNVAQTSKDTGVSRVTIGKWRDRHHPNTSLEDKIKHHDDQVVIKGLEYRDDGEEIERNFITKILNAKSLTLEKIIDLIKYEKNLDRLVKALTVLDEMTPPIVEKKDKASTYIFQQINNHLAEINEKEKREKNNNR